MHFLRRDDNGRMTDLSTCGTPSCSRGNSERQHPASASAPHIEPEPHSQRPHTNQRK